MDSYETRREARHVELTQAMNGRFDKLEESIDKTDDDHETRIRNLELTQAGNAPIIKGVGKATVYLVCALIAGYVGSLYGGS